MASRAFAMRPKLSHGSPRPRETPLIVTLVPPPPAPGHHECAFRLYGLCVFWTFHVSEIPRYEFFGVRRLSPSVMSSRFVHVVARVSPSLCFMDKLTFFGGLRACERRGPCQESVGVQVLSDCLVHPLSPPETIHSFGKQRKGPTETDHCLDTNELVSTSVPQLHRRHSVRRKLTGHGCPKDPRGQAWPQRAPYLHITSTGCAPRARWSVVCECMTAGLREGEGTHSPTQHTPASQLGSDGPQTPPPSSPLLDVGWPAPSGRPPPFTGRRQENRSTHVN